MILPEIRQTILSWHENGMSQREISRRLGISRNTIRQVLRHPRRMEDPRPLRSEAPIEMIRQVHDQCRGNLVRVREVLDERGLSIPYSTLTRLARRLDLKAAPVKRVGRYSFAPGQEMQHDTSPHRVIVGGKPIILQCASLVLAYSRRLYFRYFPSFTRFEARVFLSEALEFMSGACERCTIDNTSVLVAGGSGPLAQIAPEMQALGRLFGTTFVPHRVNNPDRKGRVERPFAYIEGNFLAGRTFKDLNDLNEQARRWCVEVANRKLKRLLGMSPEEAHAQEKPHLKPLPPYLPPVYLALTRVVDMEGYINLQNNRYSTPDRYIGKTVEVQMHWDQVRIFFEHQEIAVHQRMMGIKNSRVTTPGHHGPLIREKAHHGPTAEEMALRGDSRILDQYVDLISHKGPGRGVTHLRRLLQLKRTYPDQPFTAAIAKALTYGLIDMARLEKIILQHVAGDFFHLGLEHESDR